MNNFVAIHVDYIRPNRTIETILISKADDPETFKILYLYNFEGKHFRLFENLLDLFSFLDGSEHSIITDYSSEKAMDNFLSKMNIDNYNQKTSFRLSLQS